MRKQLVNRLFIIGLLAVTLILSATVTACREEQTIIGEWRTDTNIMAFQILKNEETNAFTIGIEFLEDGTAKVVLNYDGLLAKSDAFLRWNIDGNKISVTNKDASPAFLLDSLDPLTGTFNISDDTLTISLDSGLEIVFKRPPG
ncbi:MAG: hypothetical protein LBU61_05315 [Coriobacteriales bacterium]|jgi:hypothetical protein|nr:hypothetical protein [Coriobacteriales bacterium]